MGRHQASDLPRGHTFGRPGRYQSTLTVTDFYRRPATSTVPVTVYPRPVPAERFTIAQVTPYGWEQHHEVNRFVERLSDELCSPRAPGSGGGAVGQQRS